MVKGNTRNAKDDGGFKFGKEAVGILLIAAALLSGASLLTYNPGPPALNALGFAGVWLAERLFEIMGLAAYGLPLFFVYWAIYQFRGGLSLERIWRLIVMLWGIFFAAAFLSLTVGGEGDEVVTGAVARGGAVGLLLRTGVAFAVGRWLGLVLVGIIVIIAWAWAAVGISPRRLWNATATGVDKLGRRVKLPAGGDEDIPVRDEPLEDERALIIEEEPPLVTAPPKAPPAPPGPPPPIKPPRKETAPAAPPAPPIAPPADLPAGEYRLPPLELLAPPAQETEDVSPDYLADIKRRLEAALTSYRVQGRVREIRRGPRVTRFELELLPGQKFGTLKGLEEDLARNITVPGVTITSIASRGAVAVDVPNPVATRVGLREVLASHSFQKDAQRSKLTVAVGRRHDGAVVAADLAKMPHLLVAGATGSGKSIFLNATIASLLMTATPAEVQFLIIDPKRVDLVAFKGIPHRHYLEVIITEVEEAVAALKGMVGRMEGRYRLLAAVGARNIESYNKLFTTDEGRRTLLTRVAPDTDEEQGKPLPYIVVVVDELNDLMTREKARRVEEALVRLAQMARAVGIHLVVATQRPSVDVITGVIKANFPSRLAFKVSSQVDSRTILDRGGAEHLLPEGDMLFVPAGAAEAERVQGAYVGDDEIHRVVKFWAGQPPAATLTSIREQTGESERGGGTSLANDEDELFEDAAAFCINSKMASVSMLQRRFKIGFARAGRLVDLMERRGVVGPAEGSKPRKVLVRSLDELYGGAGGGADDDGVL